MVLSVALVVKKSVTSLCFSYSDPVSSFQISSSIFLWTITTAKSIGVTGAPERGSECCRVTQACAAQPRSTAQPRPRGSDPARRAPWRARGFQQLPLVTTGLWPLPNPPWWAHSRATGSPVSYNNSRNTIFKRQTAPAFCRTQGHSVRATGGTAATQSALREQEPNHHTLSHIPAASAGLGLAQVPVQDALQKSRTIREVEKKK